MLSQFYNSALFLSAAVIALPAGLAARSYGRKPMMMAAGLMSLLGTGLQAGAHNRAMLYSGRIAVGFGVGTGRLTRCAEAACHARRAFQPLKPPARPLPHPFPSLFSCDRGAMLSC